jgi:hypothetical protein
MSGGRQAAYGYRYQYLVTAEFFLRYLRDHLSELASTVLHVEPPTLAARGAAADDDIVDFGIEVAGEVTTTVQVKGSASASCNELHPGEAHKVFARLAPGPGRQAFLLTNRLLSTGLLAKCVETDAAGDLWKQWSYLSDDTSSEGSGADHSQLPLMVAAVVIAFLRGRMEHDDFTDPRRDDLVVSSHDRLQVGVADGAARKSPEL